jgi:hypothetical protein
LFPVRELGGNDLGDVFSYLWWALSNSPEETPFCIEVRGEFRLRHVFRSETVEDMLVVSSALLPLWGYSGLEVVLRFAINKLLSLVVPSWLKFKIFLHHIKIIFVVLFDNPGVLPN